jgi:hypothetical protein
VFLALGNDVLVAGSVLWPSPPGLSKEGGKTLSRFTVVLEEVELEAGAMHAVDVDGTRVLVSRH